MAFARCEIDTRGAAGLRYRFGLAGGASHWKSMQAFAGSVVNDTAGAGDWFTAGFVDALMGDGSRMTDDWFRLDTIESALNHGQALALMSCEFEGARGIMYELTSGDVKIGVDELLRASRTQSKQISPPVIRWSQQPTSYGPYCSNC